MHTECAEIASLFTAHKERRGAADIADDGAVAVIELEASYAGHVEDHGIAGEQPLDHGQCRLMTWTEVKDVLPVPYCSLSSRRR